MEEQSRRRSLRSVSDLNKNEQSAMGRTASHRFSDMSGGTSFSSGMSGEVRAKKHTKKRIKNRSELMEHMLFPENNEDMMIIPSNKTGTGFLNHCYEPKYLKNHISELEFNSVVLESSRIAANAYSKKRLKDKEGIKPLVRGAFYGAIFNAILSIILLSRAAETKNEFLAQLTHLTIASPIITIFIVIIWNWKKQHSKHL